jgi:hypothetical protein
MRVIPVSNVLKLNFENNIIEFVGEGDCEDSCHTNPANSWGSHQ